MIINRSRVAHGSAFDMHDNLQQFINHRVRKILQLGSREAGQIINMSGLFL